jgi:competence protein ComEC
MRILHGGNLLFIGTGAFALGVLCRTLVCIPAEYIALSIFFGLHVLAFWLFEKRMILAVLGISLVVFPLGALRASLAPQELPSVYSAMLNTSISLTGTIVNDPDIREKNQQLEVAVNDHDQQTKILVFAPLFQHFSYGEKVLIAGMLTKPAPFATDTGRLFHYDQFLAKKGIFSLVQQGDLLKVASPSGAFDTAAGILFGIKHVFVRGLHAAIPSPYADLATGLLTGDQHGISDALENSLALSGLIWVVVLSGYHVTLIADAVLAFFVWVPQKGRYALAILSIVSIIIATGASAPSLRGGIMACLMLFAHATGRTYDALRALAVTLLLILLWNPDLLAYDSGFQLSIVVTPALLLCTPILSQYLLWIKNAFVREVVAVSVVAQLACLPLIIWQTGNLSVWAIPANMLVMPFVPFAMLCSMGAGVVGVILSPLASIAGLSAYGVLFYIGEVANISTALPFGSAVLPQIPFWIVPAMYGVLIGVVWWLKIMCAAGHFGAAALSAKKSRAPVIPAPTPLHSRTASPLLPN